jgi:GNAT superfamily N-acetyltransferase
MVARFDLEIREATVADIPEIVRQRRRMYEDMHCRDADALRAMAELTGDYLRQAIPAQALRAWIACDQARPVAGAALLITSWPAHPYDLECRRATILNVYTEPSYRRRGIARQLLQTIIAWCRREGLAGVTLHASDDGRRLYESLGFETGNEMRLKLR